MGECAYCRRDYVADRRGGKFCSLKCVGDHQSAEASKHWEKCAICHAALGIGIKNSAKILGMPSANGVSKRLQKIGVERADSGGEDSWALWRRKREAEDGRWEERRRDEVWRMEWMKEIRGKPFFDWSYLWYKEKARGEMRGRYAAMSDQEKWEWNRRTEKNRAKRLKCPDAKRKYLDRLKEWKPDYYRRNPGAKLRDVLSSRLSGLLRDGKRGTSTVEFIGCSMDDLVRHLERQFIGHMRWENYGSKWHVDHVIPCAAFDHSKDSEVRRCWHFTNLRPLWAKANLRKGAKVTKPQMMLML